MFYGRNFLFILAFSAMTAQASIVCTELFDGDITKTIDNGRQSISSYRQPNARNLTAIKDSFGREADEYIDQLKKGSVVIDSGSGFSIAGIQLATKGMRVFAINAQNAWDYFLQQLNQGARSSKVIEIASSAIKDFNVSTSGTSIKRKFSGSNYYYDVDMASMKDLKTIGFRLIKLIANLQRLELFNYFVGFSDLLLKGVNQSADLIIDHWGALFYSPNRTLLLDSYYENLKVGGRAFIRVKGSEGEGVNDRVIVKRGRTEYSMYLVDYLVERYPDNFKKLNNGKTLMIIRTQNQQSLGLQNLLNAVSQTTDYFSGGTYPGVIWQTVGQ